MKNEKETLNNIYKNIRSKFDKNQFKEFRELCPKPNILSFSELPNNCFNNDLATLLGCLDKDGNDILLCHKCPIQDTCYCVCDKYETLDEYIKSFKDW